LVRQTKSSFDDYESVYELDGEIYGSYLEGYDKCRPTPRADLSSSALRQLLAQQRLLIEQNNTIIALLQSLLEK
jgi:hypothetical protein